MGLLFLHKDAEYESKENYIQNSRTDPLRPGALGLGESIAGVMNNTFTLFSLVTPICAAIIADSWLGRFRTLCLALWSVLRRISL